jgi:putative phage-type endonuclease
MEAKVSKTRMQIRMGSENPESEEMPEMRTVAKIIKESAMKIHSIADRQIITGYTQMEWLGLRSEDITSTDAAALFGISPYLTAYELWHRKKSKTITDFEVSERMKWGTRLQDSIATGIAEDNEWKIRRMDEYIRLPQLSMGASFDFDVTHDDSSLTLLEIKNVDARIFKEGWTVDGENVEAPPFIELQVQHQFAVSGYESGHIGALVGGNNVVLIPRKRDEVVIAALKTRVEAFWKSIWDNVEPKPDFVKDAEFIRTLYKYAEPGKVMAGTPKMAEMVSEYQALGRAAKMAEEARSAIKAELLTMIADAEKVVGDTFSISAGLIGPTHVEYDRAGYRDFRCYTRKEKKV